MRNLVMLIACSFKKNPEATEAADLYAGELFKKAKTLAELRGATWFVLSAEYGLLSPQSPVQNYNKKLSDLTSKERDLWGERVASELSEVLGIMKLAPGETTIEIFAGELYYTPILTILQALGFTVTIPLQGLGIGRQLQSLNNQLTKTAPL